ncbi:MAG: type IV secretory system conjugative DNA transfer family protein [Zoogloeaceae bacterium]|jgi:hypothetical protein|nr:type IV secretory system conjugative DNA transfer family protein [Zoogloeaceae bacterium]
MDGRLVVVGGASRSGKTQYVMRAVASAPRVCAWDIESQYCELPGWERVTTKAALLAALERPGAARIAYVASGKMAAAFDFWAGAVYYSGRYIEPVTAIAEELADVTSMAKAPGNWGVLLRRGLKRGITIYAISQRWAEADKTAMGNASEFVIFRQATASDEQYIAARTRIPLESISGLKPLEFVRYDASEQKREPGRLRFDETQDKVRRIRPKKPETVPRERKNDAQ